MNSPKSTYLARAQAQAQDFESPKQRVRERHTIVANTASSWRARNHYTRDLLSRLGRRAISTYLPPSIVFASFFYSDVFDPFTLALTLRLASTSTKLEHGPTFNVNVNLNSRFRLKSGAWAFPFGSERKRPIKLKSSCLCSSLSFSLVVTKNLVRHKTNRNNMASHNMETLIRNNTHNTSLLILIRMYYYPGTLWQCDQQLLDTTRTISSEKKI